MDTYDATSLDYPLIGEPACGTHLVTQRRGYEHHGVYVGHGRVVHYAGFADAAQRAPVEEVTIECFARGQTMWARLHPFAKYTGEEAVARARSRLGEDRYRLLTNNCEHFCVWCLFGEARSKQVEACLAHPRIAIRTVASLARALIGYGRRSGRFAAQAV
ncbi:lecithin retinol acyltransferase family protein [Pararobbsia silviterrae]|nr:lecithin retinol acyltransferase family protein [Pararobbsia silviterrae]